MTIAASCRRALLLAAVMMLGAMSAVAEDKELARTGTVHFAISCSAPAQQQFDRAVALLHSFWYEQSVKSFKAAAEIDPGCAMAHWGIAMSLWYPLWYPPSETALKTGVAEIETARLLGAKTERERDYINAIAAFYTDWDKLDHRTRSLAYEKAMAQVHQRYPDDREAAVFYALALDATALSTDKTYANQREAAAILEKVHSEAPDHPGVLHYLIHSYDSPVLAEQALPAARRYGEIAPAVPHALHMPSHIFTRLGLWQEAIASNRAAHDAARAYAQETLGPDVLDQESLHTMDYLEYAYLQGAQDRAAKAIVDELAASRSASPRNLASAYAIAAIPARFALERRDWGEAVALTPRNGASGEKFPWAQAITSFTNALGAAHTGDAARTQTEIARLAAIRDQLKEAKDIYWANQVEVQRQEAAAVLAYREGKNQEALDLMQGAVTLEATMEKHPATPGAIVPARELLGDLLLEFDQPAQALDAYQETLRVDPNRFRSVFGAAQAAERLGNQANAKTFYKQLAMLCERADTERPELVQAREFLATAQ